MDYYRNYNYSNLLKNTFDLTFDPIGQDLKSVWIFGYEFFNDYEININKFDTFIQVSQYQYELILANYSSIIKNQNNHKQYRHQQHNKMSHLINTDDKTQPKCLFSIPCKQVITPKYRQMLRKSISTMKIAEKECLKEEAIMNKLCEKLAEKELRKLQVENQKNLRKQFQRIKKRLQNSVAIRQGAQSQVLKYFQGREDCKNLSSLLKIHDQNIYIGIKYRNKIMNKLLSIKESSEVQKNKQKYRSWLNSCNNSPLTSPNFSKMNYVIEKIGKNKEVSDIFSLHNSRLVDFNERQKMRVTQLVKVGEKSGMGDRILVKQVCGDYSPKSKHSMLHKQSY